MAAALFLYIVRQFGEQFGWIAIRMDASCSIYLVDILYIYAQV